MPRKHHRNPTPLTPKLNLDRSQYTTSTFLVRHSSMGAVIYPTAETFRLLRLCPVYRGWNDGEMMQDFIAHLTQTWKFLFSSIHFGFRNDVKAFSFNYAAEIILAHSSHPKAQYDARVLRTFN